MTPPAGSLGEEFVDALREEMRGDLLDAQKTILLALDEESEAILLYGCHRLYVVSGYRRILQTGIFDIDYPVTANLWPELDRQVLDLGEYLFEQGTRADPEVMQQLVADIFCLEEDWEDDREEGWDDAEAA